MGLEKHLVIAPELIIPADWYTFTIGPKDAFQAFDSPNTIRRFHDFKNDMVRMLKKFVAPYAQYILTIEVSKLGRLHCHGRIRIHDILGFYLKSTRDLMDLGTFEIDTIDDFFIWETYCNKSNSLFGNLPVRFTSETEIDILQLSPQDEAKMLNRKFKKLNRRNVQLELDTGNEEFMSNYY